MYHRIINNKVNSLLLLFALITLLTSFKVAGIIVLQDEAIPFKPAGFYIADVNDERTSKSAMAQLVVKASGNTTAIQTADIQGGASTAIGGFINRNLFKDESQRPVIISLKDLKLNETPLTGNRVDGQVKINLSFGLKKDYGTEPLVNYQGGFHYIRPLDNSATIEIQLRKTIINGLIFFNNWVKSNASNNIKLANKVKISFTDYSENIENDTIYYATNRPLTWADFKAKAESRSSYAAQIMPSVGYDEEAKVINGTVYVTIAMKTYVPKSTCWVKSFAKDDYTLNHEQRHFDIVKIIAEQYKHKVLAEKLTPDNFEAFINMQYLDSYRDMHTMQEAYDKETSHGRDQYSQLKWAERIDKALKTNTWL